jgi:hypothetical protein
MLSSAIQQSSDGFGVPIVSSFSSRKERVTDWSFVNLTGKTRRVGIGRKQAKSV